MGGGDFLGNLREGPVFFTGSNFFMRSKGGQEFFCAFCAIFPLLLIKNFRTFGTNFPLNLSVSNLLTLYSISFQLIGTFLFMWSDGGL